MAGTILNKERGFGMGIHKNAFKNGGIFTKTMILITCVLLLSFLFSFAVLQYVYRIYDKQIYEKASEVLGMSSLNIENELRELEQLSFTVVTDEQIQQCLRLLQQDPKPYERLVLNNRIINRLVAFAGAEKYVYSMLLLDTNGGVMSAGNRQGVSQALQEELKIRARDAGGSNAWYTRGDGNSLLAVRQIKSYTGSTFTLDHLGTLVISIRIDRIIRDSSTLPDNGGQLIVADAESGRAVYPEKPILGENELREELALGEAYRTATFSEGTYFVAKTASSYMNWTYINATPFNEMFKQINLVKRLVLIIFAIILFFGLLLGYRLARSIVRPIMKLTRKMRQIEHGGLDNLEEQTLGRVSDDAQDEVSLLQRTFKLMIRRIRELIDENYAKQLTIRETELKALQAQINPHFLYNTLESINWLAKMNKQTQISQMAEALGHLLRSSIGLKDTLIPLRQELAIVNSYVYIQQTRFEERLDFRLEAADELHDALVPKLVLQPLVENAIRYALEPKMDTCTIAVTARREGERLLLEVSDDGPGMTERFVADLLEGKVQTRGEGIGLANIRERVKLVFGAEGEVGITSCPDGGTLIQIVIPLKKGAISHV